jgi:hypothetical protein
MYDVTIGNLQLWRPVTALLFLGELQFRFVVKAYLAYNILYYTENDIFGKYNLADYLMLMLFNFVWLLLIASFQNVYFLSEGFLFALLYV